MGGFSECLLMRWELMLTKILLLFFCTFFWVFAVYGFISFVRKKRQPKEEKENEQKGNDVE